MSIANGIVPVHVSPRMRWIWLGGSITSDLGNPLVPTHRLVLQDLQDRGQDIEYLEPADHPAFVERLTDEGSEFYRSFLADFPALRYRRYDMPRAAERNVWLSREAALADVVIIESGAPPDVFEWIEMVEERTFVRILLTEAPDKDPGSFDLVLGPPGSDVPYECVLNRQAVTQQVDRLMRAVEEARMRLIPQE